MNDEAPAKTAAPFLTWWRACLRPEEDTSAARALRARLRRADSVVDVLAEAEVHKLAATVPFLRQRPDILADIVCTLALVKTYTPARLARQLGPGQSEQRALSKARFEKLMRASRGELRAALRRALPMTDYGCNIEFLAHDIINWDIEDTRQRWWFDYFHTPPPIQASRDQTKEQAA